MRSLYQILLAVFTKTPRLCTVMEGMSFRAIPATYSNAVIQGIERQACVKVWNVAVKTVEPDSFFKSHAAWMTHIQFEHADTSLRIGELEHLETLQRIKPYMRGVHNFCQEPIKNH